MYKAAKAFSAMSDSYVRYLPLIFGFVSAVFYVACILVGRSSYAWSEVLAVLYLPGFIYGAFVGYGLWRVYHTYFPLLFIFISASELIFFAALAALRAVEDYNRLAGMVTGPAAGAFLFYLLVLLLFIRKPDGIGLLLASVAGAISGMFAYFSDALDYTDIGSFLVPGWQLMVAIVIQQRVLRYLPSATFAARHA